MSDLQIGNRIPHTYFVTEGVGESDITVHAGSYHLALRDAGIEMCNIMRYSSILPKHATEIEYPGFDSFDHGEVMEVISAEVTVEYGSSGTAGLIYGWLYDSETGERYGGLVCEYSGSFDQEHAEPHLREMLNELHVNGYEHLQLRDITVLMKSVTPEKMYGTAIVAICFTSFVIPNFGPDMAWWHHA